MKARRYIHEDGGFTDDRNGWNQLAAEDAGRAAGERIDQRERHSGGEGWKLGQRGGDVGGGTRDGQRELQRERNGGDVDRHVGRAYDQGSRAAAGDRERDVQRASERGGGQDGREHAGLAELELDQVLTEATVALGRLDSVGLQELERRAVSLQALIAAMP